MITQFGSILLKNNRMDAASLDAAIKAAEACGMRLGDFIIHEFGLPEDIVYQTLAEQFGLPFMATIEERVDRSLVRELPIELFREGRCFPLYSRDEILGVAVSDPLDLDILIDIELTSGKVAEITLTTPSQMQTVKEKLMQGDSAFRHSAGKISRDYEKTAIKDDASLSLDEIRKRIEEEPVVKMVALLFDEAITQRASDIHIEPGEESALVRFRIDGMLHRHSELPPGMYMPVTSRIKILANLDIAEKRIPQDGRIRFENEGKHFDFRVSTLPTHYGEKTVVRILKHDLMLLELKSIGLTGRELDMMHDVIDKPQGMIFVTGPTGSGKSSTLFACLNRIRGKAINITTIENPIEYKLEGVNQVQINEKAGVTFATTLRSILRQDPDVILIGEIRDRETAEIAMQASQTGHLVFSTLHTNDSVSAITRLKDLGIPGYLISSSLLAVLAQRLVRRICSACKQPAPTTDDLLKRWKAAMGAIALPPAFEGTGCIECGNTGFSGRTGIFEMFGVTEDCRGLIAENITETRLRKELRSHGMKTMIENGVEKIRDGVTTPQELLRVVMVEDILSL
jgi:type II secretory ATPase GspE/PulE/Tfp pilus assembly ATPase PilB-like protein